MSILETISDTKPMVLKYLAITDEGIPAPPISQETILDFCFCEHECDYQEPVFAFPADSGDEFKNDRRRVLYRLLNVADVIVMELFKGGVLVDVLENDDNGTFFDIGDLTAIDNPESALYTGYELDWVKIYGLYGSGVYQVKATASILGTPLEILTNEFNLTLFSEEGANKTVRIETIQNGNIESSQFDYTNMNWYQAIRIPGKFWNKQPQFTTENTLSGSRSIIQVQDSVRNLYTLTTNLLNSVAANEILYDLFLANTIQISDYNIFNFEIYRSLEVYPEEFGDATYFHGSRKGRFEFVFTDKKQNNVKRNF